MLIDGVLTAAEGAPASDATNNQVLLVPALSVPVATGKYEKDCRAGRRFAERLAERIVEEDAPYLLAMGARSIFASSGGSCGVAAGFFHAIAERTG